MPSVLSGNCVSLDLPLKQENRPATHSSQSACATSVVRTLYASRVEDITDLTCKLKAVSNDAETVTELNFHRY